MSNTQFPGEIPREALVDAPDEEWLSILLENYNQTQRQLGTSLKRGLSTKDNTTSGEKSLNLAHGVELPCANPLSVPIKGIYPVQCEGLEIDSTGKPTGQIYTLGMPDISWRPNGKNDGGVIIKAVYPPPSGRFRIAKSANQTGLASNANTSVTWDVNTTLTGDSFTHSTSSQTNRIVCNQSGIVRVGCTIAFVARTPAAGDSFGFFVAIDGTAAAAGSRYAACRVGAQNFGTDTITATDDIEVTAGHYLEVFASQGNAAAATRDLVGNNTLECKMWGEFISPADTTLGRVNLFFYGG